eukprot:TRINITY_DN17090_c0_g1_i1.p1 TRINITY_DN17090_c0_g1~~TRINITY_DN17090_c0_g1_i1.p1  ORF type:complete len:117 (-),score=7.19 TRINITY_DN17090_c0_g1_i1:173-523(-)
MTVGGVQLVLRKGRVFFKKEKRKEKKRKHIRPYAEKKRKRKKKKRRRKKGKFFCKVILVLLPVSLCSWFPSSLCNFFVFFFFVFFRYHFPQQCLSDKKEIAFCPYCCCIISFVYSV